jgi:hypothetical protein
MKPRYALVILLSGALTGCETRKGATATGEDPYAPKLKIAETNFFSGRPEVAYRFTTGQLALMARTKLDTNRFLTYIERRWPVERLASHCAPTNTWLEIWQNLVPVKFLFEVEVHKGKAPAFDRFWVYVGEDDGHNTYFGEAGTKWHRWSYSLNMRRATDHWAIIEELPNDFMDSAAYGTGEPSGPANRGQPARSETNRPSAAAGSGR